MHFSRTHETRMLDTTLAAPEHGSFPPSLSLTCVFSSGFMSILLMSLSTSSSISFLVAFVLRRRAL